MSLSTPSVTRTLVDLDPHRVFHKAYADTEARFACDEIDDDQRSRVMCALSTFLGFLTELEDSPDATFDNAVEAAVIAAREWGPLAEEILRKAATDLGMVTEL